MSFSRPFQWYHSHADPIWPDGTFKCRTITKIFGIMLANSKIKNMFKSKKRVNGTIGVWGGGEGKYCRLYSLDEAEGLKAFATSLSA